MERHDTHEPTPKTARQQLLGFIEAAARIPYEGTLYGVDLPRSNTLLVAEVVDMGADIPEYRDVLPTLYILLVMKDEGNVAATITLTDGYDGYLEIKERGRKTYQHDDLSQKEAIEKIEAFMDKWHITEHVRKMELN